MVIALPKFETRNRKNWPAIVGNKPSSRGALLLLEASVTNCLTELPFEEILLQISFTELEDSKQIQD